MTDEKFASACAAIEVFALNHAYALEAKPYDSSADDVFAVVRKARYLRYNHRQEADRIEQV